MRLLFVFLLFLISGCAVNKEYAAYLATAQASNAALGEVYKVRVTEMGKIAASAKDGSAQTAAVMAMAMIQMPTVNIAPPPESETLQAVKAVAGPLAFVTGMWISSDATKHGQTMSRDIAVSSNQMVSGLGNNIASAGVAGYPFVQAPQPNQTFSGTGVWGSGTYSPTSNSWSNSYNRNCTGGSTQSNTTGTVGPATC